MVFIPLLDQWGDNEPMLDRAGQPDDYLPTFRRGNDLPID